MPAPRSVSISLTGSTLGGLLADVRQRERLSLAEAARRAGTSRSTLRCYEDGSVTPGVGVLARIFSAYGYDLRLEIVDRRDACSRSLAPCTEMA